MKHNEGEFVKIPAALVKIQKEVRPAMKDTENDFFGSSYADLESVIESVRPLMVKYGLSLMQFPTIDYEKLVDSKATMRESDGSKRTQRIVDIRVPVVSLETRIDHPDSGEWMAHSLCMLPMDNSPQAIGSTITYARRYSLNAILGLVSEDDDGNAGSDAQGRQNLPSRNEARTSSQRPAGNGGTQGSRAAGGGKQGQKRRRSGANSAPAQLAPIDPEFQKEKGLINVTLIEELKQMVLSQEQAGKLKREHFRGYLKELFAMWSGPEDKGGIAGFEVVYPDTQVLPNIPATRYAEILEAVKNHPESIKAAWQSRIDQEAKEEAGDDGVAQ